MADAAKQQEKQHRRCEKEVESLFKKNPEMAWIMTEMKDRGCDVTQEFFKCKPCAQKSYSSYDPGVGSTLCENNIKDGYTLREQMMRTLINAYDHCRVQFNFNSCFHLACTEVRATNLSRDCTFTRELRRGNPVWKSNQHRECVRRKTVAALKTVPQCEAKAEDYADYVLDDCISDMAPFSDYTH